MERVLIVICSLRAHEQIQSMVLVAVFVVAELIPVYLTLDSRLLAMLSVEDYEPLLESSDLFH